MDQQSIDELKEGYLSLHEKSLAFMAAIKAIMPEHDCMGVVALCVIADPATGESAARAFNLATEGLGAGGGQMQHDLGLLTGVLNDVFATIQDNRRYADPNSLKKTINR